MAVERITPGTVEWDAYYANHICRYKFASEVLLAQGRMKVLDAACGSGFGAHYLACTGIEQLIAIDRNDTALKVANANFAHGSIIFLKDDCHTLENASRYGLYDAIVSMETLEHLPQPEDFLKNSLKNLKKNGILIVSTPNQLVSSPDNKLNWEFHEKEYAPKELIGILQQAGFDDIKIYGQQFTSIGKLRQQIRGELNSLNFNPLIKLGKWVQKSFRGRKFKTVLPEQEGDFEIMEYLNIENINRKGIDGPFVLVAVCKKA